MFKHVFALLAVMVSMVVAAESEGKEITYSLKNVPSARFNHDKHLSRNRDCKACHNGLFNLSQKHTFTMADMEKGLSCGNCHNGKKAFGVTTGKDCSRCHNGLATKTLKYRSAPATDAVFSHQFHTQIYSCYDCHTKKFDYHQGSRKATMAQIDKGKSCGICHNGKDAFASTGDCQKCHLGFKPGQITFKGKTGTVVGHFSHEFHGQIYKCEDCHTKLFPFGGGKRIKMKEMEQGKSCGACHDGKTAFNVTGSCAKCHKKP